MLRLARVGMLFILECIPFLNQEKLKKPSNGRGGESLVQIRYQIVRIFDSYRKADDIWFGTRRFLLFGRKLPMGCRSRVDYE